MREKLDSKTKKSWAVVTNKKVARCFPKSHNTSEWGPSANSSWACMASLYGVLGEQREAMGYQMDLKREENTWIGTCKAEKANLQAKTIFSCCTGRVVLHCYSEAVIYRKWGLPNK